MYRLAHVTDPHFRSFTGAWPWRFAGKRALGMLNILLHRRRKHRMALLVGLGEHLCLQKVDHLAVTGDLGNVSLLSEWRAGRRWLETYAGHPDEVSVIPGNHDTYVVDVVKSAAFEKLFAAYQTSDARDVASPEAERAHDSRERYPFVRFRGPLALIALNSCVPTGDLGAWGQLGGAQLARLEEVLQRDEVRAKKRVVMLHHPPVLHRAGEGRNLRDRQAFVDVVRRAGADLVLHGHDHSDLVAKVPGPQDEPVFVIGAGSASYEGAAHARARYNVYEFADDVTTAVTFAHNLANNTFQEVERKVLR